MAKRLPLVEPNLIDKAIAIFSPAKANARVVERTKFEMLSGGYTGGKVDRAALNRWTPGGGSANADIIPDLPMLRARSSDQMRNSPVALGAINTATSYVVGTGLSYTPAIDAELLGLDEQAAAAWQADTKRRFDAWANSPDCDLGRRLNFYGIQQLIFPSMLERGDVFIATPRVPRAGLPARLALQMIEADRVCNPHRQSDTETRIDGVEIAESTGETVAYWIARKHPGDLRTVSNEWDRVAARGSSTGRRNVLHLFKMLRIGQVRGVPWIAPILEPLKQLNRYTDAELNAAVISGLFSVFVKMDPEAFDNLFDEDAKAAVVNQASSWSGEMESGKAINLLPGESIESSNPGRPNAQFDPFWQAIVRQIGMALEIPFEVLVMHFQSSYSAARGALLMAWKGFRTRRDFLITNFCQPVFELWLDDEVAEGRISAPGYFSSEIVRAAWRGALWTGDGPGSIDPVKEVQAAQERVDLGISTLESESIQYDGVPWEAKHRQRVKEINAQKAAGIYIAPGGNAAPQPGQSTPPDNGDTTDTTDTTNGTDSNQQ